MRAFFLLLLAAAISMLAIPLAMRLAPRLGMVDEPDPRKIHHQAIPRVGGLGIVFGSLLPLLLLDGNDPTFLAYVAGCLVLFAFGAWDDARQIGHWPKFVGQIIAAALIVYWGDLYVTRLPFADGEVLDPWMGRIFTLLAMIGVINAVNHSDGLDGLAGGETLLSFIAIALLGFLAASRLVTDVALAAIGGTLGFLRYNTHPAKVFMGDSGSQFLGFTAAFLVIYLVQVANPAISAASPLLLLGLPLADILMVLYKRASGGLNWFKATRNHIHHRMLDVGFTHYQSVVCIYSLQAMLVISAVVLRYASDGLVIGLYLALVVALFLLLNSAERTGWRLTASTMGSGILNSSIAGWRPDVPAAHTLLWFIAVAVSALCLFPSLWAREVPPDFGIVAAVTAALVMVISLFRANVTQVALRAAAYVTAAFAAWLFTHYPRTPDSVLMGPATLIIAGLALALAAYVRFASDRRFGTTPTDFLIAFVLLVLAIFGSISGSDADARGAQQFLVYAIVLFYGCEVIIGHLERWRTVLGGASLASLLIISLRGLLG